MSIRKPERSICMAVILCGLISIVASAQQPVTFDNFEYSGEDHTSTGPLEDGYYRNPILAGFHPDPSICRVEDDYYLINSTFETFPGLPIFHSKDLVNWEQIGHVIHRSEQMSLSGMRMSRGNYAPAISYNDGLFYVICTNIDGLGNYIVTAEDPAGPWSDPIRLNFDGIDPSLFFDDDGRAWMVNNGGPDVPAEYDGHRAIWVQEYSVAEKRLIGPRKVIINGGVDFSTKPVWIEGPHIYKRGDWYYLCCAEGGTSTNHSQVILRSEKPDGPYVPWEKNPILTQRDLDGSVDGAVTCTGHADLVIGPDGNWWAVFLAMRPYANEMSAMGRETFLLPVTWTDDDWPMILPPGERVPLVAKSPNGVIAKPTVFTGDFSWSDDFSDDELSMEWIMIRNPQDTWWKVEDGKLALTPREVPLNRNPSFLGRRVRHADYTASITMDVPEAQNVSAGLLLIINEGNNFFLAAKRTEAGVRLSVQRGARRGSQEVAAVDVPATDQIQLRLKTVQDSSTYEYKIGAGDWETVADEVDARNISSTAEDAMFLGALVGPYTRID